MNFSSLIRSTLPLVVILLNACGGGGGGSSTATPSTTGASSVVYAIIKSAPPVTCPTGGITVQSGIDTNGNGILDPSEVTSTQYVCNGVAGPGITWVNAASSVQAASNTGYLASNTTAQVTITLPAAPNLGDIIQVTGIGAGGWTIAQNAGQSIIIDNNSDLPGASTATTPAISGGQHAAIELQHIGGGIFTVLNYMGNVGVLLPGGYVYEGGLIWMPVSATTYTEALAASLCAGTINGLPGWRLPTEPELSALYSTYPNSSPVLSGQGWSLKFYNWTSTLSNPNSYYAVDMTGGFVSPNMSAVGSMYSTCVR